MSVLISGANGFVGRALCERLARSQRQFRAAARCVTGELKPFPTVQVGSIGPDTDWCEALSGIDCVVHLAARVHMLEDASEDPIGDYRRANTAATERLAWQAAAQGVRRLVFLSSIKVNGNATHDHPFTESDTPQPEDAYAISKWEAEQALTRIASETGLQVVVLRPPLVYGPRVRGNFLTLLRAVARGFPLPLGAIENRRSLIYVGNLVDAIITCLDHPAAAGQTFLVSDGEAVSTPELITRLADALGRPARLIPVPPVLLRLAGVMTGKSEAVARLLGSLQVDSSKIERELGWCPPYSMAEGLRETAAWFKSARVDQEDGEARS